MDLSQINLAITSFLAVLAIYVSVKHNRRSVLPLLGLSNYQDEKSEFIGWLLKNEGLGPAFITSTDLYIDGDMIPDGFQASRFQQLVFEHELHDQLGFCQLNGRVVIPSGGKIPLLELSGSVSPYILSQFKLLLRRLRLVIKYVSLHGEKQVIDICVYAYQIEHQIKSKTSYALK